MMKCPICGNKDAFHLILSTPKRLDLYPQGLHCQQCFYVIVIEHAPAEQKELVKA